MRFILAFLFVSLETKLVACSTCSSSLRSEYRREDVLEDMALEDTTRLLNASTVVNDPQCFQKCSLDCRCLSYNVCGKNCQLIAGRKEHTRRTLRRKVGCRHYDMPRPNENCVSKPVKVNVCCARLKPPCFNGGTCYTNTADTTSRVHCACPSGYYGDRCEVKNPKSCLAYWKTGTRPISMEYTLVDDVGTPYSTYCDFDSEDNVAWTLFESFKLENEAALVSYPFLVDHPLNVDAFNWQLFRLPKNTMEKIGASSKYWRATCSYPEYGVDFRDYVRVRMSDLNPTTFLRTNTNEACQMIDYIDIKGVNCFNCTTRAYQLELQMLHIATMLGRVYHGCTFDTSTVEYYCSNGDFVRHMGCYFFCVDPSYRCTETSSSTTQFWFGEIKH